MAVVIEVDFGGSEEIADAIIHGGPLGLTGDTPWDLYRALRERDPVFHSSQGMWIVTRYRDALKLLLLPDSDLGVAMRRQARDGDVVAETLAATMLYLENPEDTLRQRRLVRKALTRRSVQRLRPAVQGLVDELLDRCAEQRDFDVMNDYADHIPVAVICMLLGVPHEDVVTFRDWTRDMSPANSAIITSEVLDRLGDAMRGLRAYMTGLIVEKRANPGEDLLSLMIQVRDEGDQLSEEELIGFSIMTLLAGSDTTGQLMAGAANALGRFPEQMGKLQAEPELMPEALEELIRHSGPVHYAQPRKLRQPLQLGAVEIPAGDTVLAIVAAANRDPDQFEDPDALDVERRNVRHLGFSQGMHICIGAMLARLEAEVAIGGLLRRFRTYAVVEDPVPYVDLGPMRGIRALRVAAEPA